MMTIFFKHLSLGGMGFRTVFASILVFAAVGSSMVVMAPGYFAKAEGIVASSMGKPGLVMSPPGGPHVVAPSLGQVVADATREMETLASSLIAALSVPLFLLSLFVGSSSSRYDKLMIYLSSLGISRRGLVIHFSIPSLLLSLAASASGIGLGLTVSGLTSTILSAIMGSAHVGPSVSSSLLIPSLLTALSGWLGFLVGSAIGVGVVAGD